ncbi:MAG: Rpp14/Pop5 family protein [Candidatus Bilamarchaeum sp.]
MKKRYILFALKGELDSQRLKGALTKEALRFFGELGLSEAAIKILAFDTKSKTGVLRCKRDYCDKVLGFLALLNSLDGSSARLVSLQCSGTLKSLEIPFELPSTHSK